MKKKIFFLDISIAQFRSNSPFSRNVPKSDSKFGFQDKRIRFYQQNKSFEKQKWPISPYPPGIIKKDL